MSARDDIMDEVSAELLRQDRKWGEQNHPDGTGMRGDRWTANHARLRCDVAAREGETTWRLILDEEVAEAYAETDPSRLREELVQVAAVAVQWVAAIDRRERFTCDQCSGQRVRIETRVFSSPDVDVVPGFCEAGCDRPRTAA